MYKGDWHGIGNGVALRIDTSRSYGEWVFDPDGGEWLRFPPDHWVRFVVRGDVTAEVPSDFEGEDAAFLFVAAGEVGMTVRPDRGTVTRYRLARGD